MSLYTIAGEPTPENPVEVALQRLAEAGVALYRDAHPAFALYSGPGLPELTERQVLDLARQRGLL